MIRISIVFMAFVLSGCGTFVPVTDTSKISKSMLREAYKVKTFTVGSNKEHPEVKEYLGEVTAYSCKHMIYDPPASKGNALTQLRLKAFEMGADGILDVTFDSRGTDTWGTNCWESVQASGIAVRFK